MLRLDSRKCKKQQKERAWKERFVLVPLWYEEKRI